MLQPIARRATLIASMLLLGCSPEPTDRQTDPSPSVSGAQTIAPRPATLLNPNLSWTASWAAAPGSSDSAWDPRHGRIDFHDVTIRQTVRLSAGGEAVRLRLSNEFGDTPLQIGAAAIARLGPDGAPDPDTIQTLTFAGLPSATIPAGAPFLSDPIPLEVDPLTALSISLYLPDSSRDCTCHGAAMATGEVSPPGDYTTTPFEPRRTFTERAFLSGVEVLTEKPAQMIVAFGDSITDGWGSTPDTNQRWPDILAERLTARQTDAKWAVINAGVTGNELLSAAAGPSALARFDRDVLTQPGVTHVIVFIGINDIANNFGRDSNALTVNDIISGYRQLIARARSNDIRIYGATLTPFKGWGSWSPAGETARQTINAWIRESGEFDAVLDFDAALADPADPASIATPLHNGDHLHGSDAGYQALARSIELDLFE